LLCVSVPWAAKLPSENKYVLPISRKPCSSHGSRSAKFFSRFARVASHATVGAMDGAGPLPVEVEPARAVGPWEARIIALEEKSEIDATTLQLQQDCHDRCVVTQMSTIRPSKLDRFDSTTMRVLTTWPGLAA